MKVEVAAWALRPNEPYGFCGRKATLNRASALCHSMSLICQPTSEDMKLRLHHDILRPCQSSGAV